MGSFIRKIIPNEIVDFTKKVIPKEITNAVGKYIPNELDPAGIFDERGVSTPNIPEIPTPKIADTQAVEAASEAAAKEQQIVERRKRGKKSTILTGGLGLKEEAKVKRPTILGTA